MRILDALLQDIRYAARSLARRPALTLSVAITLLVGIGLNTAVFAAIDGMVFRARNDYHAESFVQILADYPKGPPNHGEAWTNTATALKTFRDRSRTLTDFGAWRVIQGRIE